MSVCPCCLLLPLPCAGQVKRRGEVVLKGSVAYVPQTAYIVNASVKVACALLLLSVCRTRRASGPTCSTCPSPVRFVVDRLSLRSAHVFSLPQDNITFGLPFEPELYQRAVTTACLQADLDMLPAGGCLLWSLPTAVVFA